VCRDPVRSVDVEESFKDSRRTKLRRSSAFMHRPIAVRRRRKVKEKPLEDLSSRNIRRDSILRM
jgi:hypothetical protein